MHCNREGKPVNLGGDGEGMQVPCTLLASTEENVHRSPTTTAFKHRKAGCVICETANCFVYPKKRGLNYKHYKIRLATRYLFNHN